MLLPSWGHDTIVPMFRTSIVSLSALSLACSVMAQAPECELNVWLACGITTVRPTLMVRVKEMVAEARRK